MSSLEHQAVSSQDEFIPSAVTVTNSAADKVFELMQEEGELDLKLRVSISGGGCSGFQYQFAFERELQHGDLTVEKSVYYPDQSLKGMVTVVIDPVSLQYLMSAEIDYVEDTQGARFVIRNPNASTTCGCGSSFAV